VTPAPEHLVEAVLLVSARPVRLVDLASAAGLSEDETERSPGEPRRTVLPEGPA
jgi:chromosome segregation and condensation protein ScpB